MAVRNNHWYNANETRSYPLDESSTLRSDQGDLLPSDIITDINLRYPGIYGDYPFLASVGITENLVSLTIQAATAPTGGPGLNPLAVFSLAKDDLVEGRPYALEGQVDGAGGWIVFGSGIQEPFTGRFSGPAQALLAPRAARAYSTLPLTSLAKLGNQQALTGVVQLLAEDPLQIVRESREIDGVERDVIVLRLYQAGNVTVDGREVNVFQALGGPCVGRPESQTCGDPTPIEFINTVGPDCDGNLTLVFQGCAEIAKIIDECGIVIDCDQGLTEACVPKRLPGADGTLPNEYPDLCFFSESPEPEESESPEPEESISDISESPVVVGELPFIECFVPGDLSAGWDTKEGLFAFIDDNSPDISISCEADTGQSYASLDTAKENIAIWEGFDDSTVNRVVTTDFKMTIGPTGSKQNAGVILNYRPDLALQGANEYFLVRADYDTQRFEIVRFDGSSLVLTSAFVFLPGLKLDAWYRIVATVTMSGSKVLISATIESLDDSSLFASIGPITSTLYLPDTGYMGIYADHALSRFSWFEIKEAP